MQLVGPETAGGSHGVGRRSDSLGSVIGRRARAHAPPTPAEWRAQLGGQLDYSLYFLNGSHHDDGLAPPFVSNHVALYGGGGAYEGFFSGVDDWVTYVAKVRVE